MFIFIRKIFNIDLNDNKSNEQIEIEAKQTEEEGFNLEINSFNDLSKIIRNIKKENSKQKRIFTNQTAKIIKKLMI